jgi:hypothetical protein
LGVIVTSCKKKGCTDLDAQNYSSEAEKDDGTCTFYEVPSTYAFTDAEGNSTVSYSGQTDRLNQLDEMTTYMKTGTTTQISSSVLMDMFYNTNDNGNGNFSFSSSKQLGNKCFASDSAEYTGWFSDLANASADFASTASDGQAGTLTSGTSTYLFDANGVEHVQLIEKGLMGAVFMNQALNSYFGSGKMNSTMKRLRMQSMVSITLKWNTTGMKPSVTLEHRVISLLQQKALDSGRNIAIKEMTN